MKYEGNQLKNIEDEYANSNQYGVKEYRKLYPYIQNHDEFFYDTDGNPIADLDR